MTAPVAMFVGQRVTWFLGKGGDQRWRWTDPDGHVWHDAGAEAGNEQDYASGLPYNTPGIALANTHHTLGGWFRVFMPRIHVDMVCRHIDVAPHGDIDFSAPLAYLVFTVPGNVDGTPWSAASLGRDLAPGMRAGYTNTRTGVFVPIPETL